MSGDQYRDVGNMVGEMKKANNKKYAVGDLVGVGHGRAPGRIAAVRAPNSMGDVLYDVVLDQLVADGWCRADATIHGVCENWLVPIEDAAP